MDKAVFACIHNAGRSQMAAAFFNRMADPTRATAISAGTEPALHVHPAVVAAMKEVGIDLASARPQKLTRESIEDASLLITMGCGDACPYVPGLVTVDWPLDDPAGRPVDAVRRIRDDIRSRVSALITTKGWQPSI